MCGVCVEVRTVHEPPSCPRRSGSLCTAHVPSQRWKRCELNYLVREEGNHIESLCALPLRSSKVLAELKELVAYRRRYLGDVPGAGSILALGLSSRKNLCVHPQVAGEGGEEEEHAFVLYPRV